MPLTAKGGTIDCSSNYRLLLASVAMRLRHPLTGDALMLTASPADDFADLVRRLGMAC